MTNTATIFAGSRLTALGIRGTAPLSAYKSSNQSVTSSTVPVLDSALVLQLQDGAVYDFEFVLGYNGGTLGSSDLKWALVRPGGATMGYTVYGNTTAGTATAAPWYTESSVPSPLGTNGTSTPVGAVISGTVSVGGGAGALQLEWAQNTSNATATTVLAGSVLLAWQVQ